MFVDLGSPSHNAGLESLNGRLPGKVLNLSLRPHWLSLHDDSRLANGLQREQAPNLDEPCLPANCGLSWIEVSVTFPYLRDFKVHEPETPASRIIDPALRNLICNTENPAAEKRCREFLTSRLLQYHSA